MHREVNGPCPAYFPQRKLTRDEISILEKTFWEMISGNEDVLPVYGFLKTYFMKVADMKNYVKNDDGVEDVYKDDFGYDYRDNMIAQFKQGLSNKTFSLQDQDECDVNVNLRKRNRFWLNVIDMGGPILDNVYDFEYDNPELDLYLRRSGCDSDLGE